VNRAMDETPIDRPIFVIGTGRSGLTPLMDLIAYHESFAWPSQYNERWPKLHAVSALSRIVDVPSVRSHVKFRRGVPKHTEAYPLWGRCFPGFAEPFRDLVAEDVTPYARRLFRQTVADIVRYQRKTRFIAEYSGWSRIAFLRTIFPDARFIHIVRDGRAVAHSYTNVDWWNGWEGVYRWRLGIPDQGMLEKLERYEYSFLALAAVYWKILVTNISDKGRLLPSEDFLLVRYEDLVADPNKEASRCIEFAGVDRDKARFEHHLRTVKIIDANSHGVRIPPWRESFQPKQIEMFNDLAGDELAEFNYT
jgi:omega-hydroxy-beta-dihydromenaquinone-9 sulfotransferase